MPPADKKWLIEAIKAEGVTVNIHYHPLHMNGLYRKICDFKEEELKGSVDFYNSLIRLPLYPALSDSDASDVIAAVTKVFSSL